MFKTNKTKKPTMKDLKILHPVADPKNKKKMRRDFKPMVTKEGVVLTARSLLLNQEISFFIGRGGVTNDNFSWRHGSLSQNLNLSPEDLVAFKGKEVLDLAGGASILPEELVIGFGAEKVTVVDLFHTKYKAQMNKPFIKGEPKKNRAVAAEVYVENLKALGSHIPNEDEEWADIHQELVNNSKKISKHYFNINRLPIERMAGDATKIPLEDDSVDEVFNTWMLMYLSVADRKKAIQEMVRVTRPGGRIRIVGGGLNCDGADGKAKRKEPLTGEKAIAFTIKKLAKWFVGFDDPKNKHFGGKYVAINADLSMNAKNDSCLVVLEVMKKTKKKKKTGN